MRNLLSDQKLDKPRQAVPGPPMITVADVFLIGDFEERVKAAIDAPRTEFDSRFLIDIIDRYQALGASMPLAKLEAQHLRALARRGGYGRGVTS
jgi:hypothetical protein